MFYGRFTLYDFVACNKLTTGLRHELYSLNQTCNPLTTVAYVLKMSLDFKTCFGKLGSEEEFLFDGRQVLMRGRGIIRDFAMS